MLVTQFKWTRTLGMLFGVSVFLFYGCDSSQPQQAVQQAPPAAAPAVKPAVSVNAVMVALVDHAGHVVWDAEQPGRAPKTDADWAEIEHHAIQLTASGALIALGGTGQADPGWAQSPDWQKYSQELTNAGLVVLSAARSKNQESLVKANGQLVEVCESCHKEFKPDLPTEGLVHTHK
jgi:cytochrome c556